MLTQAQMDTADELIQYFEKEGIKYERDVDTLNFIWLDIPRDLQVETTHRIRQAGWHIFTAFLQVDYGTEFRIYMRIGITTDI